MNLRPAALADADALAGIHAASFDAPWPAAELAALIAAPGAIVLLAEAEAGPFAFVLLRAVAGEAEVLTLAVDPARRRRGAALALMTAAIAAADAAGAENLFLEVACDNPAALALYAQLGFEAAGLRKAYYKRREAPAVDAHVLRLDFTGPLRNANHLDISKQ